MYDFKKMHVREAYGLANAAGALAVAECMATDGRTEKVFTDCAIENAAYNRIMDLYDAAKDALDAELAEKDAKITALPNAHTFVHGLDNAPECPECGESLHTVECPAGGAVWWHCDHCDFDSY